ncbi:MAG: hypothetical protein IKX43_02795 [Paludibacteraceae bacterium]|nr:hypothetical protein [Paludibacteraceae bacterium]
MIDAENAEMQTAVRKDIVRNWHKTQVCMESPCGSKCPAQLWLTHSEQSCLTVCSSWWT